MEDQNQQEQPIVYKNAAEEIAAIELSIKKAQLSDIKLQQQERELNLRDLRERIGDRETRAKQKDLDRKQQGITFAQQRASDEAKQASCTHNKGGTVSQRDLHVLSTGGNSVQYAVIKHQMINGDFWVRCLRCGKTWLPPVRENYCFNAKGKRVAPRDGTFSAEKFAAAEAEYLRAVQFETNNSPSGSVQCRFSKWDAESDQWVDATKDYRGVVKNTNLR